MKTVFITKENTPAKVYTDYAVTYRIAKGTTSRILGLLAFCKRIDSGKFIVVGDTMFVAAPSYHAKTILLK